MTQAKAMGMEVDDVYPASVWYVRGSSDVRDAIKNCIHECAEKQKTCDMILVPMTARNTENYATVKAVAEKEFGIVTQVVLQRNIRIPKPQTCGNIALKINAKLGGVNCKLAMDAISQKYLIDQATLILGLDVTHPAPTDRKAPSIGAAVGNIDKLPGMFCASITVQKHRREAVVYLIDAIRARVEAYYRQTQTRPERVIIYRDGVDEGHFAAVLREESKGIKQACTALFGDYMPKVTFIVVQKRHHIRFFPTTRNDQCGKAMNVPPGTVVDNTITHTTQFDFFLCSHFGIQGTSRPAHYHVLKDDSHFTQDELQAITYSLCHIYARCTRSVSIPAPTYYAHLACARARHHLHEIIGDANSDTFSEAGDSSSADSQASEESIKKAVEVAEPLLKKMYFC